MWPKRPDVDWVADALRNQLKDVYSIQFELYSAPPLKDDKIKNQYKESPMVYIHLFNGNGSYTPGGGDDK